VPAWSYAAGQFPEPPATLSASEQTTFEHGWHALTTDNLELAARTLEGLARERRGDPSVEAALGYVDLRTGDRRAAENRFEAALDKDPTLGAAQAGWSLTALAAGDNEAAFARLKSLARDHPDNPLVREFLPELQLELAETRLQQGRSLRQEGHYQEAAEVYRQAIEIAPGASGLYIELASAEVAAGEFQNAAEHAAQAIELDPGNVEAYRIRGDALRQVGDLEFALEAYRQAMLRSPDDSQLAALYQETRRAFERESLPSQYFSIAESARLSREGLAALLFVKLRPAFDDASGRSDVIITDISDSWARQAIRDVVAARILDVYPNHTFQPQALVRRADLAVAFANAMRALAPGDTPERPPTVAIADVPPNNLNYPPVALSVSLGLMATDRAGDFEPQRVVTGAEAIAAADALARRLVP
jgi:tetratricopeptide (TPR) repeat protein